MSGTLLVFTTGGCTDIFCIETKGAVEHRTMHSTPFLLYTIEFIQPQMLLVLSLRTTSLAFSGVGGMEER